jgi:UDP-glucose 4-epimerase
MKQWTIKNDLSNHSIIQPEFFVGDIRDLNRVKNVISQVKPDNIIIAAALKQVDTCELSPYESIQTNLIGTQNVIQAISEITNVTDTIKKVLFVSTDKACAPVNVYGMCKATSERIVTSQAKSFPSTLHHMKKPLFMCTRYGNVLESRGSIIPLFKYQAENAKFLTVTDPNMTRFVMTLDDSVDLIQMTLANANNGETWIPVIPSMKIGDLAEIFAERYNKEIKVIGLRPGEKQHEDLINESESVRTTKFNKNFFAIKPAYMPGDGERFTYSSVDDVLSKEQLKEHLIKLGIFDMPLEKFQGLKIEEIITNRK